MIIRDKQVYLLVYKRVEARKNFYIGIESMIHAPPRYII